MARSDGTLRVKETMAITMIDGADVAARPFEQSHLLAKMSRAIVVARVHESVEDDRSFVHSVSEFDLDEPDTYEQVRRDYELVRKVLSQRGLDGLSGSMGVLVQPRTKGTGHGSTSRAFYARAPFVARIVGV